VADFALSATACETALWPAGTFNHAYAANRRAAIAGVIDADPVAAAVREIMAERTSWTGSAADLLRACADCNSAGISSSSIGWPRNPRTLAGRLRRAQTFLRVLGIDIAFSCEGHSGSRIIRIRRTTENTVCTVSSVAVMEPALGRLPPPLASGSATAFCPICPWVRSIGAFSVKRPLVLTVLTQTPALVSGIG
jgi:hypothetical protein